MPLAVVLSSIISSSEPGVEGSVLAGVDVAGVKVASVNHNEVTIELLLARVAVVGFTSFLSSAVASVV